MLQTRTLLTLAAQGVSFCKQMLLRLAKVVVLTVILLSQQWLRGARTCPVCRTTVSGTREDRSHRRPRPARRENPTQPGPSTSRAGPRTNANANANADGEQSNPGPAASEDDPQDVDMELWRRVFRGP